MLYKSIFYYGINLFIPIANFPLNIFSEIENMFG